MSGFLAQGWLIHSYVLVAFQMALQPTCVPAVVCHVDIFLVIHVASGTIRKAEGAHRHGISKQMIWLTLALLSFAGQEIFSPALSFHRGASALLLWAAYLPLPGDGGTCRFSNWDWTLWSLLNINWNRGVVKSLSDLASWAHLNLAVSLPASEIVLVLNHVDELVSFLHLSWTHRLFFTHLKLLAPVSRLLSTSYHLHCTFILCCVLLLAIYISLLVGTAKSIEVPGCTFKADNARICRFGVTRTLVSTFTLGNGARVGKLAWGCSIVSGLLLFLDVPPTLTEFLFLQLVQALAPSIVAVWPVVGKIFDNLASAPVHRIRLRPFGDTWPSLLLQNSIYFHVSCWQLLVLNHDELPFWFLTWVNVDLLVRSSALVLAWAYHHVVARLLRKVREHVKCLSAWTLRCLVCR